MIALLDLQSDFARTMLNPRAKSPGEYILEDGMPVGVRLDVYRNNILESLTDVLVDRFPVVCRVVDERFFRYASDSFIRAYPPQEAVLSSYGEQFADFLATFPPCRGLAYLPDLARLEWLIYRSAQAPESTPTPPERLTTLAEGDLLRQVIDLSPSLGLLRSSWPVDRILYANQGGADDAMMIDLNDSDVCLMVLRVREDVGLQRLSVGDFTFCRALLAGATLAEAVDGTVAIDPRFEAHAVLAMLFSEDAVVGCESAGVRGAPR